MSLHKIISKPVAWFAGKHADRQISGFRKAHFNTPEVQQKLLEKLIYLHRDTDFAKDHKFSSIRSYDDFQKAVPVSDYQGMNCYFKKVLQGNPQALFPEDQKVLMFSMTSGTTGKPKYIPVTERFARHMKYGWNVWGMSALKNHNDAWTRQILQITSPMREKDSPTGLPCGAISGLLAKNQKYIVRKHYAFPFFLSEIRDPVSKYYAAIRCSIEKDIAFITTANPSSTIKLIETGRQYAENLLRDLTDGTITPPGDMPEQILRQLKFKPNRELAKKIQRGIQTDGEMLPEHFWNVTFLANWTGGTLKLFLPRLKGLFGQDIPICDIGLLASEGRFSIPLESNTASGVAEITGNFLEFLPADDTKTQPLLAHEVEIGKEYFLVVTNFAGLWRYNMDDRVLITGKFGHSPVFEFLSRGKNTANITGEKITEHQVVQAMQAVKKRLNVNIERFVMQPIFANTPYYMLTAETNREQIVNELSHHMDELLGEINIEYRSKRASGRLGPIKVRAVSTGFMQDRENIEINKRRGRCEQYKHTYLLSEITQEDNTGE